MGLYEEMARELAPYQGRPKHSPVPVGDPLAGSGIPTEGIDAGTAREVGHVYAPDVARSNVPGAALSESVPEQGGFLLPPTWAGARRRR